MKYKIVIWNSVIMAKETVGVNNSKHDSALRNKKAKEKAALRRPNVLHCWRIAMQPH
jgi:hypothetical protein